jgi:putative heme degradation protein
LALLDDEGEAVIQLFGENKDGSWKAHRRKRKGEEIKKGENFQLFHYDE